MSAPVSTPFGLRSTAAEVLAGVDLSGRRAIVTGASSGIGVETARALAGAGAEVTLAVRDTDAGASTAAEIAASENVAAERLPVAALDLSRLDSVAAFAAAWDGPLDILVNNAGVMAVQELELIGGGWERQFAVNHVGHFALTSALHGALAASGSARVVSVSSSGHLRSPVIFDDLHFAFREYEPWSAYGQAKTANILLAVEIAQRWARDGIAANALMPGGIMTRLQRHLPEEAQARMREQARGNDVVLKTPEQGAATSVLLAASPLLHGVSGRYFHDCQEQEPIASRAESVAMRGVAPYALDRGNAARLWEVSERLVASQD
jgi:NAD(P)-dependent dehydrogenase (short-subunit alcohol dehydrogenase family)